MYSTNGGDDLFITPGAQTHGGTADKRGQNREVFSVWLAVSADVKGCVGNSFLKEAVQFLAEPLAWVTLDRSQPHLMPQFPPLDIDTELFGIQ